MIIYLDESGDLGLDFSSKNPSRYLVMGLLVFLDNSAHTAMIRAVKRTLKNKLPKTTLELKGSDSTFQIKKYFLKEMNKREEWRLYAAIADKKSWVEHHIRNHHRVPEKKALYDELAKRLFSQVDYLQTARRLDVVVDRSKRKDEIAIFDQVVSAEIKKRIVKTTYLRIRHGDSRGDAGLQAIDMFCSGISGKYEFSDETWYREFSDRVAVEIEYKF